MVEAGDLTTDNPEPEKVPPHKPVYHFHIADVPAVPPEKVRVDEDPEQIFGGLELADVGAIEFVFIISVMLRHKVVLQMPSALT